MTTLASMQAKNFLVVSKHISTMVTAKFIQAAKNIGSLESNELSLVYMIENYHLVLLRVASQKINKIIRKAKWFREHVHYPRESTNVVFMAMGDNDSFNFIPPPVYESSIW